MQHKVLTDWLRHRLQQDLPGAIGQERMAARVRPMPDKIPDTVRPSAVLCLLFPKDDIVHMLLIKRIDDGKAHGGQIGFPGGKQDPTDADLKATALREAHEEVGLMPADTDILGTLTPLYIPVSNFQVYPFLAVAAAPPSYHINTGEVEYILEMPLHKVLHPDSKTVVNVTSPVMTEILRSVRAYRLEDGHVIWGATAMIISELETILEEFAVQ